MRLRTLFVALLVIGLDMTLLSQSITLPPAGTTGTLVRIRESPFAAPIALFRLGEMCSEYFHFDETKESASRSELTFVYTKLEGSLDMRDLSAQSIEARDLEIRQVSGLVAPWLHVVSPGPYAQPLMIIMISPEDFSKAPCLKYAKHTS